MANSNQAGPTKTLYLDDLHVGQRFTSDTHLIDEEQIKAFAKQFDPQPFHLDAEAAKATLFEGLVASGWHTAAITMRLLVESGMPIAGGVIGAGGEISLAKADAAGRCPPCRERNHRSETVALSSRPRAWPPSVARLETNSARSSRCLRPSWLCRAVPDLS